MFAQLYEQLQQVIGEGMSSAKRNYLHTNKVSKRDFDKLAKADPSRTKRYIDWMCKQFVEGNDIDQVIVFIRDFDKLVEKGLIKDKDIYSYDYESATSEVEKHREEKTKTEVEKAQKKGAEVILDTDKVLVILPKTREAAVLYGKGTKWCTSALKNNAFDEYFRRQHINLYIIISKKTNRKYCMQVDFGEKEGKKTLWDEVDAVMSSAETKRILKELGIG